MNARPLPILRDLPGAVTAFGEALGRAVPSERSGLYLVGSPALGDLSPRQSNLDLVAVTERPLTPGVSGKLAGMHRSLRLHGRDASVCYTTWEELLSGPGPQSRTYSGRKIVPAARLANAMTWAILAGNPVPVFGPERPEVASDPGEVSSWFRARMPDIVERTGALLWRRSLTRLVLEAARSAHGALTGEVLSLHEAGERALPEASHTGHRVITDALGYREGANTSMYWGPFERKSNAIGLAQTLLARAASREV